MTTSNSELKGKLKFILESAIDEATVRVEDLGHRDLIELIKATSDAYDKMEKIDIQKQKLSNDESAIEAAKPKVNKSTLGLRSDVDLNALLGGTK